MSISDEIQNEINKAGRIEDEINTNLKRRYGKIEKKLSTSIEDKKLKFQVDNYLNTINGIKSKIGGNPEFNYRFKEQVNKFYSTYGEFKKIYDSINIQQSSNENSLKESPFSNQKAQEDLPKYFTRQEYEIKKEQQFKEGDEILSEISGTAKIIKKGAIQIRDEIHLHDPLLSDLEKNIDKIDSKMKRSENKLANYLKKSSDNCLYWTIAIEFVFLILFFAM